MNENRDQTTEKNGKEDRMCNTAMREHSAPRHAERARDNIGIGNDRANRRQNPKPKRNRIFQSRFT